MNLTDFKTANFASGRIPPVLEVLEEEVNMRKYRSTSCRDPREYKRRMIVS